MLRKSKSTNSYKENTNLSERVKTSVKALKRFPKHIPIVIETKEELLKLDKCKFLCPENMKVAEFSMVIRKRLTEHCKKPLKPETALYLFINNIIPTANKPLRDIYDHYKDEDGLLYITYCKENTFG